MAGSRMRSIRRIAASVFFASFVLLVPPGSAVLGAGWMDSAVCDTEYAPPADLYVSEGAEYRTIGTVNLVPPMLMCSYPVTGEWPDEPISRVVISHDLGSSWVLAWLFVAMAAAGVYGVALGRDATSPQRRGTARWSRAR